MEFEFFDNLSKVKNKTEDIQEIEETTFNYTAFEIEDIKNDLIEEEKKVELFAGRTMENLYKLALTFERVRGKLANRKNGAFVAWCMHKGFNREYVSVLTKKLQISKELRIEETKAMALPNLTVKQLTKIDADFSVDEKLKIVNSDKPQKKLIEVLENKKYIVSSTDNISKIKKIDPKEQMELKLKEIEKEIKYHMNVLKELNQQRYKLEKDLKIVSQN